ncbi:hypothetical protein ACDT16_13905, partial [Staphylococcus aureus]
EMNKEMSIVNYPPFEQVDFSEEFRTDEIFDNRESLVSWAQTVGRRNNMVVLVKRSDSGDGGRRARIVLGCERGGKYRPPKRKLAQENSANIEKKQRPEKLTGTKKCDCPFQLKGAQFNDLGQ